MSTEGIGPHSVHSTYAGGKAAEHETPVAPSGAAFNKSVSPSKPDPGAALPRSKGLAGITLAERKISNLHLQKEGFLTRLKSWLFKKPTANDQYVTGLLFSNLLASLEKNMSNPGGSDQLFLHKGITVAPGSAGHKVCALMADMGLVKFIPPSSQNSNSIQVEYLRPDNLEKQLKLTEMLFESVPLTLSAGDRLDWNVMTAKMSPQTLNNLVMAGALKNHDAGWRVSVWSPDIDSKLKHYAVPAEGASLQDGVNFWSGRIELLARELAEPDEQSALMELGRMMNDYPASNVEINERLSRSGQVQSLNQELRQCRNELSALLEQGRENKE